MKTEYKKTIEKKHTNKERLEIYKTYFYDNRSKISYKSFKMFDNTCKELLDTFLTTRKIEILIDLKEHTMFISEIYKQISENNPNEEYLPMIKDKFSYYKNWIISESDITIRG